jgi:hypothetical protein
LQHVDAGRAQQFGADRVDGLGDHAQRHVWTFLSGEKKSHRP